YEAATGKNRCHFPGLPDDLDRWPRAEREAMLELNEVLARACAAEPKNRHANAAELASDLNVILAGRSVRRMYGIERRLRTATRVSIATVAVLAVSAGVVWFQETQRRQSEVRATHETSLRQRAEAAEREQSRLRDEAQKAQASEAQARRRAEAQELAARKKAYASDMKLLQVALAADKLRPAQELLNRQRPQPGERDLRGWEWRYFWQFCQSDAAFTLCQRTGSISAVSFSSDGAMLAVGAYPYEATVWDLANRRMLDHGGKLGNFPAKLSFSPNGNTLAFNTVSNSNLQQSIGLWSGGPAVRRLPVKARIRDLAFTRDGRLFAADMSRSNNVTVWDIEKGDLLTNFTARVPPYLNGTIFAVTADGDRFAHAVSGSLGFVQIVDANGRRDPSFRVADEYITALAFSPDGQTLITGAGFSETAIKVWDVRTRRLLGSLEGHQSWVGCLKFLPDGKTLASASSDRTIRLWNFETRQLVRTLRGQGQVWTIDISPDGRWLASGSKEGFVMLWDLTSSTNRPPEYRTLSVKRAARSWGYSPDGRWLAAINEGRLKLHDAATLQLVTEPALTLTNITGFTFSPDMRLLLVTDARGGLGVWDMPDQRMITNFVAHSSAAALAHGFVSEGKSALTHGAGVFKEWDVATWQEIRQFSARTGLVHWASCPAANLVAIATASGSFEIIPIHDPDKRRRFRGQSRIEAVNLSPDGKTLAAASANGTVELWDTETLTRRGLMPSLSRAYHAVVISPDGQRVAGAGNGREAMKMWDFDSHEEVVAIAGQGSIFNAATFSPDGNTIGAHNAKGLLHLWTAPSWAQIEAAEKGRGVLSAE
ncbi:MAG TPA: hypothetical protein VNT99_14455, partial [Methylomirabilota bacterium]|nr:hypothetical protein [Methylomirabilota bacterium]